jgi:hypothetical protein
MVEPFNRYFPPLIGITGRARSGKDTLAAYIQQKFPAYQTRAMAYPLRQELEVHLRFWHHTGALKLLEDEKISCDMLIDLLWRRVAVCPNGMDYDTEFWIDKGAVISPLVYVMDYASLENMEGYYVTSMRNLLQIYGTEYRRAQNLDYWVEAWRALHPSGHWLIPDIRFENEAQMVRQRDGIIIRVERPGQEPAAGSEHASEQHFSAIFSDVVIRNTASTPEEFCAAAEAKLRRHLPFKQEGI